MNSCFKKIALHSFLVILSLGFKIEHALVLLGRQTEHSRVELLQPPESRDVYPLKILNRMSSCALTTLVLYTWNGCRANLESFIIQRNALCTCVSLFYQQISAVPNPYYQPSGHLKTPATCIPAPKISEISTC